jgi:hypothetical protein
MNSPLQARDRFSGTIHELFFAKHYQLAWFSRALVVLDSAGKKGPIVVMRPVIHLIGMSTDLNGVITILAAKLVRGFDFFISINNQDQQP